MANGKPIPFCPLEWSDVPPIPFTVEDYIYSISTNGLQIGYNSTDRDSWIAMPSYADPAGISYAECVYFGDTGDTYWTVCAVAKYNSFIMGGGGQAMTRSRNTPLQVDYADGEYYLLLGVQRHVPWASVAYELGDSSEQYEDSIFVTLGQVTPDMANPNIPIYSSLHYALENISKTEAEWGTAEENWKEEEEEESKQDDPYSGAGNSAGGGGDEGGGDYDFSSDTVTPDPMPPLNAVDTGFITLYNPSLAGLRALANYMWGSLDVSNFTRLFSNPMDAILGLSIIPVDPGNGGIKSVVIGNIDTGITMPVVADQYIPFDCGKINLRKTYKSYLDYDPYTKCEIYLPFIGTRPLAVSDIMNSEIHVTYKIDVLSGACLAEVTVTQTDGNEDTKTGIAYNYIGQCSASVPVAGGDWTNVINGVLQIAGAIGTVVATEGASIPVVTAAAGAAASGLVTAMRPNIEKSGAMSGMGGMFGKRTPYLILTRPRLCNPTHKRELEGFPAFVGGRVGQFKGHTMFDSVKLDGIPATDAELKEIEMLLKGGVYV